MDDIRQGIVHIIGPEQGLTLPGMTIVCGDSHTATHGAFGALAFGIGTSRSRARAGDADADPAPRQEHADPVEGDLPLGVTAKDMILAIIGQIGTAGGTGHVIEYAGSAIREPVDGRPHDGLQHVDRGGRARRPHRARRDDLRLSQGPARWRPRARRGSRRVAFWQTLPSDPGAHYDTEVVLDAADIAPQVTWGTSPQDVLPITGAVPDPADEKDDYRRRSMERSLDYMGLKPGTPLDRDPGAEASSSAPAPTAASRICAPPPRSPRAARSRPASTRWSCRARAW